MSEEIKALKDKLKKKNARIRELNKRVLLLDKRCDYWYEQLEESSNKFWDVSRYIPEKYYKVTFGAENTHGGISEFTQLHKGYFAIQVVNALERKCNSFKLIAIEETAS